VGSFSHLYFCEQEACRLLAPLYSSPACTSPLPMSTITLLSSFLYLPSNCGRMRRPPQPFHLPNSFLSNMAVSLFNDTRTVASPSRFSFKSPPFCGFDWLSFLCLPCRQRRLPLFFFFYFSNPPVRTGASSSLACVVGDVRGPWRGLVLG